MDVERGVNIICCPDSRSPVRCECLFAQLVEEHEATSEFYNIQQCWCLHSLSLP